MAAELKTLIDSNTVRVLDLVRLTKAHDGSIEASELRDADDSEIRETPGCPICRPMPPRVPKLPQVKLMNAPIGECWALKPRWQESGARLVMVNPRSELYPYGCSFCCRQIQ